MALCKNKSHNQYQYGGSINKSILEKTSLDQVAATTFPHVRDDEALSEKNGATKDSTTGRIYAGTENIPSHHGSGVGEL